MGLTSRQFTFISTRLIAAYLLYLSMQNILLMGVMFDIEPSGTTPRVVSGAIRLLAWAVTPAIGVVLWNNADKFTDFLLKDAPADSPTNDRAPWEKSALAMLGLLMLVRLLPTLVSYAFDYIQWENTPPYERTSEIFFGQYLTPGEMAARACELTLGLFLVFRAPAAWRGLQSLQNKTMPGAVNDLRELGLAKEANPDQDI
jgi:hypothetical protein